MNFSFVTIFPEFIKNYMLDSILAKAIEKNIINIEIYNPRDFTEDKHNRVDFPVISGGAGMLLSIEPIFNTILQIREKRATHIILLSPVGKIFNQNDSKRLSKYKNIVFISGRYKGIDERVTELLVDEVFSIGNIILTGGELPSLILCDAISRNINGVLGNKNSLLDESYQNNRLEAPSFAKPNVYKNISSPSIFLEGNHKKISKLKSDLSYSKTKYFQPNLINN